MIDTKDFETKVGYGLGVASIVLAFVSIIGGLVAGILGFNISKKQNSELAKKAQKLNKAGIIISIIILTIFIIAVIYIGLFNLGNLPLV